jgi:hypothetical protein
MKFDVFFISSYELNALENWNNLKNIHDQSKRIHGLPSIFEAYAKAAELSETDFFFTVDGDNYVSGDFSFKEVENLDEYADFVHVWRAQNSVNKLVYGFGGVKLWPRKIFFNQSNSNFSKYVDITLSLANGKYYIQKNLASTTVFNTSAFNAWKSAFRESVKLTSSIINKPDKMSQERLNTWLSVGSKEPFGDWCIEGAKCGNQFGQNYFDDKEKLLLIHDLDFLKNLFELESKKKITHES